MDTVHGSRCAGPWEAARRVTLRSVTASASAGLALGLGRYSDLAAYIERTEVRVVF